MSTYILSHDIGTTGDKATLFSSEGKLVAKAFSAYPTYYPKAGWAEQDALDYWGAFCAATRELLDSSGCAPGEIAAVSFSGHMMAALPIDRSLEPVRRAIIWADQRASLEASELAERIGPARAYRITGHRLSASYSAAKMLWIRENEPELFDRAAKFVQPKDFLALRLTGRVSTDFSDASGTNLLDLSSWRWSEEILEAAGLRADLLPELLEATDLAGRILAEPARACGLLAGTPVVIGGGDGACATYGAGVAAEGDAYLCLGTSTWIACASGRPLIDPEERTFTFALFRKGLYMPTGTMQAGGGSLQWLKEVFSGGGAPYDALEQEAAETPPGSEGLLFLPYLMGERSPWWNPDARGCFIGLSMVHARRHLLRAVMEGVAYNMRTIADAFAEQGLRFASYRIMGGGSRSAAWRQIFADVLERPVTPLDFAEEATSVGAAIAGGVGVGLFRSLPEACRIVRLGQACEPDEPSLPVYRRRYAAFLSAYRSLVPVFPMLARGEP